MSNTSGTEVISIRVPLALKARMEEVAVREDRSLSYISSKALEEFVTREEEVVRKIEEGIAAAEAGALTSHEQVIKDYETRKKAYFKRYEEAEMDENGAG